MQAGRLDRRITIRRATVTADAFNAPVETFTDLATVWASAMPARDSEMAGAGETRAVTQMAFEIRYSSTVADVGPKDRIVFDGRTYDINAVSELGRRVGLRIMASARAE